MRPNSEHVILMDTKLNLSIPDSGAPKLIKIAAFIHEHISMSKEIAVQGLFWNQNGVDLLQVQEAVLHICDSQKWQLHAELWLYLFALSEAGLNRCHSLEWLDIPMLRHLPQPLHAAGLVGRVTGEAHG
jgi:hypothetical protein